MADRLQRLRRNWVMLAVTLSLALFVNYVDRGSMSVAAKTLKEQFSLDPEQTGYLLSTFFLTYTLFMPLGGWFIDRFGGERVLACGLLIWSVATVMCGLAGGLSGLVLFRLLMGAGESVYYPSALSLLASRVDDQHRSRATGLMQIGSYAGPAFGTFIGGWILIKFGWHAMFVGLGLTSLLWLLPWFLYIGPRRVMPAASIHAARPTYGAILGQRALWASMIGTFTGNYAYYLLFTSLPLYLIEERGMSQELTFLLTAILYLIESVSVIISAWVIDRLITRGYDKSRVYKTALGISCAGVGLSLLACPRLDVAGGIAALYVMGLMDGIAQPSNCSMTQIFAGPLATGRWMGLQNAVGNIAGILAPALTGILIKVTGHYTVAFLVGGSVALSGVLAWLVLMPRLAPVDWSQGRVIAR